MDKKCLGRRQLLLKIGWPGESLCKDDILSKDLRKMERGPCRYMEKECSRQQRQEAQRTQQLLTTALCQLLGFSSDVQLLDVHSFRCSMDT